MSAPPSGPTLQDRIDHWILIGVGAPERTYEDFERFCRAHLRVRAKVGKRWQWVPLDLGEEQEQLARLILSDLAAGRPVRIIVLKCRKLGISTLIQALGYWFGALEAGWVTQVVAHQAQATATIANIARGFADRLYPFAARRLGARRFGAGLVWANGSKLEVFTQRSDDAARGSSPSLLHLSEVAFWDKGRARSTAEDTMVALMAAMEEGSESWDALDGSGDDADSAFEMAEDAEQAGAGTIVIIESTANGAAGSFHSRWRASQEPGSPWRGVFFGWHQAKKYTFPESRADRALTEAARSCIQAGDRVGAQAIFEGLGLPAPWPERAAQFGLSVAQARWAVRKLADLGGDIAKFDQEFPLSAEMAFAATGRRVWTDAQVSAHATRPPVWTSGPLRDLREGERAKSGWALLEQLRTPGDTHRVWELPRETWVNRYSAGSDVGAGVGGDSTTCVLMDHVANVQVAEFSSNDLGPREAARNVAILCRAYRDAVLCYERNMFGLIFGDALIREQCYPSLWRWSVVENPDQHAWKREFGYPENETTRAQLTDRVKVALRDVTHRMVSDRITAEMRDWVMDETGRPDHGDGEHDDHLFGFGLALYAADQAGIPRETTPRTRRPDIYYAEDEEAPALTGADSQWLD